MPREEEIKMRGYVTRIFMSNGKKYVINDTARRVLKKLNDIDKRGTDFWEVQSGVYIKIPDISSVEEEFTGIKFLAEVDINQVVDSFDKKLEEELTKSL